MDWNADRPRLLGDGAVNRLPDPPCSVGAELEATPRVKFTNCPQEPHVSFLDQVQERDAASQITLSNADHQPQVGADQGLVGFHGAFLRRIHFR